MSEFFHMGGYAFFVWLSYGLTTAVLLANIIVPMRRRKTLMRTINRNLRREQR